MKTLRVSVQILPDGFSVILGNVSQKISYPVRTWRSVPLPYRQQLAETLAYAFTQHLATQRKTNIVYTFPVPLTQALVFYEYLYSIAAVKVEYPEAPFTTADVIRDTYNSDFRIRFTGSPRPHPPVKPSAYRKLPFIMPFSFGKDSLTTFALATRLLKLEPHIFYFNEPSSTGEVSMKRRLKSRFEAEFGTPLTEVVNRLGNFRQADGLMWGWDTLLTQYTALLLPYVFRISPGNFFWSDENSLNEQEINEEGFIINPTQEQSAPGILQLNNLYRMFSVNTVISSLIEPLYELAILFILHGQFGDIGKYQLSCDHSHGSKRWCGDCFECARVYLFFTALGLDPRRIELNDNMFTASKIRHFYLFTDKKANSLDLVFQSYPERLLAFYLAYKRRANGPAMKLFAGTLLPYVESRRTELYRKYLSVHDFRTVPDHLSVKLLPFYREQLKQLRAIVSAADRVPGGKS
ncbi:hypothetical protein A2Z33_00840 [Candidatus Gottesmanbacteria bacterium RBG_16_52_11]|uniref:UDP-N-acetyl-alpha-D-muramoyl-L-alanyl-L-glutamate epimerase n=1 Tax=Candidatus Gottesmanbacteria bacterium RBG_16_52_11 TaxID=1798374 RepID=A0A1F5YPI1_9BACT|nr:MAG: hypothetical protein A2Z33_00840 [Candidatus Gottesmanbacteria bacterium RBG_16_52_11]